MIENKANAGRKKGLILSILLFGPAFILIFISSRGCEHKFKVLDDMGEIPSIEFTTSDGKKLSNKSFENKVILYTSIQQTCPDSCAISMWHLNQLIYQHLRKNQKRLSHIRIVSFVTDGFGNPVKNTSTIQSTLKEEVEEYDPNLWMIVTGDAKKLYDISRNGEKLIKQGDEYFGGESFQELMLLVDKNNHLRMVLNGKTEGMIRRMKEHMALLDKQYDKEKNSNKN